MTHSFDVHMAEQYGITGAVLIHNLYHWIEKNEANGRHYYDGRHWTYNSVDAFSSLFPYLTPRQVRTAINKLKEQGAVLVGNYNKQNFDRTQWYSLSDEIITYYSGKSTRQKSQMHLTEKSNGSDQKVRPIPDINTDINIYNNPLTPLDDFSSKMQEKITDWLNYKKEHRKSYKPTGLKSLLTQIKNKVDQHGEQAVCQLIDLCMANNWQGIIWDRITDVKKSAPRVYDEPDFLSHLEG